MEEARLVRQSALDTVAAIEPLALAEELKGVIAEASMVPGVVTLVTANSLGAKGRAHDRAVGVQLSYEGLRLTRQLIREEERYQAEDPTESYLALVAGEVMVSRGFAELAETPVAGEAIDIVQRFSRNQTVDYRPKIDPSIESGRSLERDVIALAVGAGATVEVDEIPPSLSAFGERLAADLDQEPLPPADAVEDRIRDSLESAVASDDVVLLND